MDVRPQDDQDRHEHSTPTAATSGRRSATAGREERDREQLRPKREGGRGSRNATSARIGGRAGRRPTSTSAAKAAGQASRTTSAARATASSSQPPAPYPSASSTCASHCWSTQGVPAIVYVHVSTAGTTRGEDLVARRGPGMRGRRRAVGRAGRGGPAMRGRSPPIAGRGSGASSGAISRDGREAATPRRRRPGPSGGPPVARRTAGPPRP